MKNILLSASIICADYLQLEKEIIQLKKGKIDYLHFDVMDGIFVPRYGLFPELITQIRNVCNVPIDVHMMTEDAEKYLPVFVSAGLNRKDDVFTVHIESTRHISKVVQVIREYGIKAGIALNPGTSLSMLDYVLPQIDLVMIMAINPGIVGHKLIPHMVQKISDLKEKTAAHPDIIIAVDGGVTPESAPKMIGAGASMLVCGSQTIFRPQEATIDKKIKELRRGLRG